MRANPAILKRERRLQLTAFLTVLGISGYAIMKINNVFVSLLIAFLIVNLLKPLVAGLERKGVSRTAAISSVFIGFSVILGIAGYLLAPLMSAQTVAFEAEMPRYKEGLSNMLTSLEAFLNGMFGSLYQVHIMSSLEPLAQKYAGTYIERLPSLAGEILTTALLAPLFAFFLLRDGRQISRWLFSLVPNNLFELSLSVTHKINEQVGGFIRARIIEAIIVGFVVWLGLIVYDFPYATILAAFAGLTNLIPYVGPIIGAVPALIVAAVDKSGSLALIYVTAVYVSAQVIDMVLIIPLVVARIVNLHPLLVILAIMAGAEVMGILGMIISIPAFSALKLIFSAVYSQLLAERPES